MFSLFELNRKGEISGLLILYEIKHPLNASKTMMIHRTETRIPFVRKTRAIELHTMLDGEGVIYET